MPIPTPRKGERQKDFIRRCMRRLYELGEDKKRSREQMLAVCYDKFRSKK